MNTDRDPPSITPLQDEAGSWRRRRLLQALAALPIHQRLAAAGAAGAVILSTPSAGIPATPSCGADAAATPRQTEGPYFTRNSPLRRSLVVEDVTGPRLVLGGSVLGLDCKPLAGALLDFWQADAEGAYDNQGFRLRGHQFTDADGRYRLETVVPGLYPGRTRHIHVKVQAKGGPVLTTQLYFPDEPQNPRDRIFSPALLVSRAQPAEGLQASFDFVVRTA
jgi:protocatechuate 3,4-dioxygenase beta subunit